MIALIQRVSEAQVTVAGQTISRIEKGLLVLLGVEQADTKEQAKRLAERVAGYRMFADSDDKMNLDVTDVGGSVLVVSQFTLAADTQKGRRPSFSSAALPSEAERLYHEFCTCLQAKNIDVQTGQFGADMQVALVNDGPVTFQLKV